MNRFVFIDGGAHIFETANTCWDNSGNVTYDKNYTDPNSPMDWRIVDPLVNPVLFFDKDINTHIKDVEFHLFEPNNFKNNTTMNILKEKIKNIEDKFNINVNLYENAISTNNEPQNFYQAIDKWGDVGSTLNSDKLEKLDLENPLLVNCIDICEFIKTFSLDD
jgi:endo-1,4-beta-mannosidase